MAGPVPEVIPQPVLSPLTGAAIFLVVTVDPGGEPVVRELLPDLAGLQRAVGFRAPDGQLSVVTGIGSQVWDRLFGGPRPAGLHPFRELVGPTGHRAVSTPAICSSMSGRRGSISVSVWPPRSWSGCAAP